MTDPQQRGKMFPLPTKRAYVLKLSPRDRTETDVHPMNQCTYHKSGGRQGRRLRSQNRGIDIHHPHKGQQHTAWTRNDDSSIGKYGAGTERRILQQNNAEGFLERSNPMAWARVVAINKVYFSNENAIHMPFEFYTNDCTAEGVALIDSGATHNFMDRRMVKQLQVGSKPLVTPWSIRNVDGTGNKDGNLTRYTNLRVTVNKQTQIQRFYIMDLAEDRALFGFPWLQEFNPQIDWKEGEISDARVTIHTTNLEPSEWAQ